MTTPKTKILLSAPRDGLRSFSLHVAPKFAVDETTGSLRDIALLTAGVEAKGHGIYIDQRTVDTAAEVVAQRKGRLKAAFRHLSWAAWMETGGDRMGEVPGYFSGVAGRESQLVAGAFQFYDAFAAAQPQLVATLLEMARKTPELFGVSIEPYGYLVFVDTEGNEFSAAPDDRELLYNGLPALRVTDLPYAAFVDEPAANPGGVFAALARKVPALGALFGGGRTRDRAELAQLFEQFARFCADAGTGPDAGADSVTAAHAPALSTSDDPTMNVIAQIKTKFSADKAKLAAAYALLADKPESTLEHIETALAAQAPATPPAPPAAKPLEMSAVVARFGADKARLSAAFAFLADKPESTLEQIEAHLAAADAAELKRLRAENTQLTADKAAADKKVAALSASGHPAPVQLGAAAGSPSTDPKASAFSADRPNYTERVRLFKQDPELAATLAAQGGARIYSRN